MASPYITTALFSSAFDLDAGTVTLTDISTYVGNDPSQVQGICFVLYAPDGVALDEPFYSNTNFAVPNIDPNAPVPYVVTLPTFSGQPQWGTYKFIATWKDALANLVTSTVTFELCSPQSCNGTSVQTPTPCISLLNNCSAGKLTYKDTTTYIYNDVVKSSIVYEVLLSPPNGSAYTGGQSFFTVPILDGVWRYTVTNTVTYEFDDNVSVIITYHTDGNHTANCSVDLCALRCAIDAYRATYETSAGRGNTASVAIQNNLLILDSLINSVQLALVCGTDTSDYIEQIKEITGQDCSCDCTSNPNSGASLVTSQEIILETTCGDLSIESEQVGFTTTFTINGKAVTVESATDGLDVSLVETDCSKTFTLTQDVEANTTTSAYTVPDIVIGSPAYFEPASDNITVPIGSALSTWMAAIITLLGNFRTFILAAGQHLEDIDQDITGLQAAPVWDAVDLDTTQFNNVASYQSLRVTKSVQGVVWIHGIITVVNSNIAAGTSVDITNTNLTSGYYPLVVQTASGTTYGNGNSFYIDVSPSGQVIFTASSAAAINIGQPIPISIQYPTN